MRPAAGSIQDDSESDDERDSHVSTSCPSSANQTVGLSNRGTASNPAFYEKTPFRPNLANLAIASSASSSGSSSSGSSTSSIIFDRYSTRVGTPLTPPISETPDSSIVSKARLASHGRAPAKFAERLVEKNNNSSARHTPTTTPTAEGSSRTSSASDLLVECVGKLSIQDGEEPPSDESYPDQNGSPTQAKKRRRDLQEKNEDFKIQKKNGESNRRNITRDASRTDGTMDQVEGDGASVAASAEPKVRRNLKLGKDASRSSRRESSEVPVIAIVSGEDEGEEESEGISSTVAQNPPPSGQYQRLDATLSAPRSHKRSKSAPNPNTSDLGAPDDSTARITPRNRLPTQSNRAHASRLKPGPTTKSRQRGSAGTPTLSLASGESRRRSTGSLDPERTVIPSTELLAPGENGRMPGAFPIDSFNLSEPHRHSPSCEPPEAAPDLEPDATRKSPPKLEHKHRDQKSENGLKNGILHVIRRTGVTKSPDGPNLDHGYVYIFKSPAFPGYIKIGSTKQAPEEREKQWSTRCNFECVHIVDENDKSFRFYGIVERIIHAELYNEQRKFYCDNCRSNHLLSLAKRGKEKLPRRTEHSEWFEISETQAKEVVNKWRDWVIHQEPYKQDATLRSCWLWKHDMGTKWMKGSEAEWEAWRQLSWFDTFRFSFYEFNKWLGEVAPLLQKLVNTSGSVLVLAAGIYLCILGVNLASCLSVMTALLLYRLICFKCC
jgi:T5orf172 domain